MKVAIDSSQSSGSVAIHDGLHLLYSSYFDIRITHSETLMPELDRALQMCGAKPADITEVYVCSGPGSFTGLRIGIATAKGIAYGLNVPVISYNSLEMAALSCYSRSSRILSVIDAKMQEVYAALYDVDFQELIAPCVLKPEELLSWPLQGSLVCGSAAAILEPFADEYQLQITCQAHRIPKAELLFYLSEYRDPKIYADDDLAQLEPTYLRESTAQIKANLASGKQVDQQR
ncbi:MAG: tRNA (adenosine(37)-N6)-threonylcarbamoyltransferase complex dimerization subunit type 1 TsaB [Candidatus Cloacimonetes bacterium]|nr:tRNA (adenosine(37)-N6)-threonylcarbamoyltransferase complex dimerization subunit type 1 TsaB [Candidatus Cloacimonadota bacterium]MDD4034912.1 tRNA (adenosine(37)-N6)-threonylcarbamoyltransferase complex dimerization subunit type 1 TsaB [Candidatus Cloacimonadota bacterium]MDD4667615.1 tRNA (adenosine(37)-N6)-threonylcarbamoyltransferase complex dimerization subunit type 1 TsaB [Candidatus Cloacimonadota bacterium]HPF08199.1 tRNA (adenosine(37)-N6)-threonylcarbamoyltransferase complex dimeri